MAWDTAASWSASTSACLQQGDICILHQTWHQPALGRHSLRRHKERTVFYRVLLFARFTLAHFIYLKAPWPSFHVYISFPFPFFLSLFFTISCSVLFFPNPQATFCIIKLYLSLRFTTFYRDASTDFFFVRFAAPGKGYIHFQRDIYFRAFIYFS